MGALRSVTSGLRSSASDEWATPPELFAVLDEEFGFTLDACATAENTKCPVFYTKSQDGLRQPWRGTIWCNPPYGAQIGNWLAKAYAAALRGATVVLLVPARTDTDWWHRWVMRAAEVRLLRKRVRFAGGGQRAPFPSAIVVFRSPPSGSWPTLTAFDGRPGPMSAHAS